MKRWDWMCIGLVGGVFLARALIELIEEVKAAYTPISISATPNMVNSSGQFIVLTAPCEGDSGSVSFYSSRPAYFRVANILGGQFGDPVTPAPSQTIGAYPEASMMVEYLGGLEGQNVEFSVKGGGVTKKTTVQIV